MFNSLFTDLNITPSKLRFLAKELAKHKKDLIYIADPNKPIKLLRKRIKRQSGTGIITLLSVLTPTITGLIASIESMTKPKSFQSSFLVCIR